MAENKDPAFLFYSKDYYQGTRMMLPCERGCYVDLMTLQHQSGYIPNDIPRLLMYCSGIDKATLEATLKAKFKLVGDIWINEKLQKVIEDRREYGKKQSNNGKIGQFFKKAKAQISAKELKLLKEYAYNVLGKDQFLKEIEKQTTIEALLEASLKHLVNGDAIENEDVNKKKEVKVINWENCTIEEAWKEWIEYKWNEKGFKFKTEKSEKMSKNGLWKMSGNDEKVAIEIIRYTMEQTWSGFVKPKIEKQTNGKPMDGYSKAIEEVKQGIL